MPKLLLFLVLVSLNLAPVQAAGPFVSVRGKEILGVDGRPFLLKGVNLGNWLVPEGYMLKLGQVNSPRLINDLVSELIGPSAAAEFWTQYLDAYVTEKDIHFLKSAGANSLRVPFNYRLFTKESYLGTSDETRGFALLDRLIGWCRKEQLYLVLDMHAAPGGQTGDNIDDSYGYPYLFDSEADQQLTADIWKKIAARYADEPIVIGYDLLNEPIAPFFDKAALNPKLEPVYKEIAAAIRSVDKHHLLFLGGAQWDQNFTVFGKPFDDQTVYTFHNYWSETTQDVIQPWLNFRARHDVPIYCGETGENTDEWVGNFRKLLERHDIGWHYWPYKKMESPKCMMQFAMPAEYKAVAAYASAPRATYKEVRESFPKDRAAVKKAFDELLVNCRFENCRPNAGYAEALGFKVPK